MVPALIGMGGFVGLLGCLSLADGDGVRSTLKGVLVLALLIGGSLVLVALTGDPTNTAP